MREALLIASDAAKSRVRSVALEARRALDPRERADASALIAERIVRGHEFMAARRIGCYLATPLEVDTSRVIQSAWRARKRIFVPVTGKRGIMSFCEITPETTLSRGPFGIWQPHSGTSIDARDLDIVITPVVAFDDDGHRVGMGGGYYDRCFHFLKNRRKWLKPKLIGLAFECQKVPGITPQRFDVDCYRVITNAV